MIKIKCLTNTSILYHYREIVTGMHVYNCVFWFISLMVYQPPWVIQWQSHPLRTTEGLLFNL